MFLTVFRSLAVVVGLLAYYVAFFMYEDEEGKWQNRIENSIQGLWVAVDDRATGKRTAVLFGKIASIITRAFDGLFGKKLVSVQFLAVSVCYCFAAPFLLVFIVLFIVRGNPDVFSSLGPPPPDLVAILPFVTVSCLIAGIVLAVLGTLPSVFPSRWAVALSAFPILLCLIAFTTEIKTHQLTPKRLAFNVALVLSLLSDVLLLALIRLTVRWVSAKTNVFRTAVTLLIQMSIFYFLVLIPLVGIPAEASAQELQESTAIRTVVLMGVLNIFTGMASSAFILALLIVLLHRISWPVLSRLLYSIDRFKVIRNRKLMAAIGTACMVFAFPTMSSALKTVLGWLAK